MQSDNQPPSPNLSFVGLATVLTGAQPFKLGNISDTYRGQVFTDGSQTRAAIIKDISPKELANEVLVAALGSFLGLPIPPAYLALARTDVLTATKGPQLEDGSRLVFASVDVGQPQVAVLYQGQGAARVRARLAEWQSLGYLYGLDTFVANVDRHEGNLLFSGDNEVWLIDHGHCFGGPSWQPVSLVPESAYPNRLKDWLTPALSASRRATVAGQAAELPNSLQAIDVEKLAESNHVVALLEAEDFSAVVKFLRERRPHIPQLAAAALEINLVV